MPKNEVPTSDVGDEVGGVLNDGTRMGQYHCTAEPSWTPMSASDRIRAAAQLRASSYQDLDDEIVSPGEMRLKVLDASSDESDVELSPTKRPRRAAVQRAPKYNLKLSLTKPTSKEVQKTRGVPQVLSATQKPGVPPSITTLLRQKHQQQRKGLDRDSLAMFDRLASQHEQVEREIHAAQAEMNAAHLASSGSGNGNDFGGNNANSINDRKDTHQLAGVTEPRLLRLLQMDEDLFAESQESIDTSPMLWTLPSNIPKLHVPAILEGHADLARIDAILPLISTTLLQVEFHNLVPWLITRVLLCTGHGPRIAMRDLAHANLTICDYFWNMLPEVMVWIGADLSWYPVNSAAPNKKNTDGCDELNMAYRFWQLCQTMPVNATCTFQFPLLVLFAGSMPYSVETSNFLSRCLPAQASLDTVVKMMEVSKQLPAADQLKVVQSLPLYGSHLELRSSLALALLNSTVVPLHESLAALEQFVLRVTAEQQRNYTQLHSQLRLCAYAINIPTLLGLHLALPRIGKLLKLLVELHQTIDDHRGAFFERSACKDMVQQLRLRIRYQTEACIQHDSASRASWISLLSD